jgi:hypothetical protein
MRHWLLALGGLLTAGAAEAQAQRTLDAQHGYLVIRVLLDGAGGRG